MGTKSKFFRAFVEGDTISDGRKVSGAMIDQIVETHNLDTYTPRINIEHIRGFDPAPPFNGYGDVFAVKVQVDDITIAGKTEKRKALYVQVDANDQLTALAAADQKPFPSVELTDSYAGCGKVGLIGLAFTDSPASIATQKLSFSRHAPGTVFAQGDAAVALEFESSAADGTKVESAVAGFFSALTAKFTKAETPPPPPTPSPPPPANDDDKPNAANDNFAAYTTALGETVAASLVAALKPVTDAQAKLEADFAALTGKLEKTEQPGFGRAAAAGGTGRVLTDS